MSNNLNEKTKTGLIFLYVFLFIISFISFIFFKPSNIAFIKYVNEAKNKIKENGYETGATWDKKVYKNNNGTFDIGFKIDKYKWSSTVGKISAGHSSFFESNLKPNFIGIVVGIISLLGAIIVVLYVYYFNKKNASLEEKSKNIIKIGKTKNSLSYKLIKFIIIFIGSIVVISIINNVLKIDFDAFSYIYSFIFWIGIIYIIIKNKKNK